MGFNFFGLFGSDEDEFEARDVDADKVILAGPPEEGTVEGFLMALFTTAYTPEGEDSYHIPEIDQNFLSNFEIMLGQTDNGGALVRFNGQQEYGIEVAPNGVSVAGMDEAELMSDLGLEATLEAAVMTRSQPMAEFGIDVFSEDPERRLVMVLSAEKAGLAVLNRDAVIDNLPPEVLAREDELRERLDEAWERIEERHGQEYEAPTLAPEEEAPETDTAPDIVDDPEIVTPSAGPQ